jgi:hypothetical protein
MKQMNFYSAMLVVVALVAFTSCKPSRVWATKEKDRSTKQKDVYEDRRNDDYDDRARYEPAPPPPARQYYVTTPLILTPTAGFVMNRYPDGRFYHRSPQGFLYWKAYDNRFYLDRSYIHRVRYDRYEYDQWRAYTQRNERPY